jgi:hypothetical protein
LTTALLAIPNHKFKGAMRPIFSAVIASGAKQSTLSLSGKMDCFAPLAMTIQARARVIRSQ